MIVNGKEINLYEVVNHLSKDCNLRYTIMVEDSNSYVTLCNSYVTLLRDACDYVVLGNLGESYLMSLVTKIERIEDDNLCNKMKTDKTVGYKITIERR